jgi:iron complex transport system substrate-binding protein
MKNRFFKAIVFLFIFCLLVLPIPNVEAATSKMSVKDLAGRTVTFSKTPLRVAVLSSGDLNTVKALGANIVGRPTALGAVDPSISSIPQIGTVFSPNFEKIVSVKPDVVIATTAFLSHVKKAEEHGLKVIITSGSSVNDIKASTTLLGKVLKKEQQAKILTSKMDSKIKRYSSSKTKVNAVILFGSGTSSLVALPNSFTGDVLKRTGGINIASKYSELKDFPGYANLSTENIIVSNPDIIFMITHTDAKKTKAAMIKLMSTSAWKNLKAVKSKNIVFLPSELFAANPGTRIIESLDYMNKELLKAKAKLNK